jgi:hypothetical protein
MCSAGEAAVGVAAGAERERSVVVVMERAECFVLDDFDSESPRDPLNREVAKLLKFKLIHNCFQLAKESLP